MLASLGLCTSAALAQDNAVDLWRKALSARAQVQTPEKAPHQAKAPTPERAKSAKAEGAADVKTAPNEEVKVEVKSEVKSEAPPELKPEGTPGGKAETPSVDEAGAEKRKEAQGEEAKSHKDSMAQAQEMLQEAKAQKDADIAKKLADVAASAQAPLSKEQVRLAQEREAKELRRSNLSVKRQEVQALTKEAHMQGQPSIAEQAQRLSKQVEMPKQAAALSHERATQHGKNADKALKSGKDQKAQKAENTEKATELKKSAAEVEKVAKDAKSPGKSLAEQGAENSAEKSVDNAVDKAAAAKDIFVLPYQPGEGAQLAMQATEAWVEVYAVGAKDTDKALQTLLSQDTPPALGVVADDTFYASTVQGEFEAPIAGYLVTRKGKELAYDVDCNVVPQKGDELRADFTSGPLQVRLQGKLTAHFVFGAKNIFSDEIVRLPGLTAENCHMVDEQRLVYQGKVTVSKDGKHVSSRDVVFQSITPH